MLRFLYGPTLTSVHDYWKSHSFDQMDRCQQVMFMLFDMLSVFVLVFLPRSKHLLISCLQPPSIVILEPRKINSVTVSTFSPYICHEVMGLDVMIFIFGMWNFKPSFSPVSPSSRGSSVPLCFLPLNWYHLFHNKCQFEQDTGCSDIWLNIIYECIYEGISRGN